MKAVIIWAFLFAGAGSLSPIALSAGEHPSSSEHPSEHPEKSKKKRHKKGKQEHPKGDKHEHPKKGKHEHPKKGKHEHPKKGKHEHPRAKKPVTIKAVAKAVKNYVKAEAKKRDGWFHVPDQETGKDLRLKLKKIHKKRLTALKKDKFFVCADFKADDKTIYDLDMFVEGDDASDLRIYDITVHKVSGKPRYGWAEKKGRWKRVPVE